MKSDYIFCLSPEGYHQVAFTEWGEQRADEVPVICAHGMTRNGRDFDVLARHLSEQGRHVFCPDIVGRGNSGWLKNKQNYSFEQYAADMTDLIARTGAKQVDWVGTSMGGLIGMIMASYPGSPIRRLIINDIGPQIPIKAIHRLAKSASTKVERFDSIEAAKASYKIGYASFGNLRDDQWERITVSSIREESPGHYISKIDPGISYVPSKGRFLLNLLRHPYKTLQGILFDIDLWYVWQTVNSPVYLIHGHASDLLTTTIIDKMRVKRPDMQVLDVPDAGHAPILEDQAQLDTITRWLS